MRNGYVVDACAWVEYLRGGEAGRRVRAILEGGRARPIRAPLR
ncbi:MAG: hypothetical protein QXK34_01305 [Candidatus Bathyarchaeia archaeon]